MTIDIREYERLKNRADKARAEADRAAGARDSAMTRLKDEFGIHTIVDAEILLDGLKEREKKLSKTYDDGLAEFKAKYGELLNE